MTPRDTRSIVVVAVDQELKYARKLNRSIFFRTDTVSLSNRKGAESY